jgi:hypothetical protein
VSTSSNNNNNNNTGANGIGGSASIEDPTSHQTQTETQTQANQNQNQNQNLRTLDGKPVDWSNVGDSNHCDEAAAWGGAVPTRRVVFDFSRVSGVDATACSGTFLLVKQLLLSRGIPMIIVGASPNVERLLEQNRVLEDAEDDDDDDDDDDNDDNGDGGNGKGITTEMAPVPVVDFHVSDTAGSSPTASSRAPSVKTMLLKPSVKTMLFERMDDALEYCESILIQVQYSTVQYSTVQYSTVQYSTVHYSTVQYRMQYSIGYSTVLGWLGKRSYLQYDLPKHDTLHQVQVGNFVGGVELR